MRSERGTTLIEFAMVFTFMMVLVIGAFEWGMGFRERLAVSQSVREATRVGAAVGDAVNADCAILEAGAGSLSAIGGKSVKEVWIYQSDDVGTVTSNKQRYRPAVLGDDPAFLACSDGWYKIETNWAPTTRDTEGAVRDWIGVSVLLDHYWKTGYLWWQGSVEWQESMVFHMEPQIVS